MPEGHTIHRLARDLDARLGTGPVQACALQDRFAAGVARIDGGTLAGAQAWGKHLFLRVHPEEEPGDVVPAVWLHVHLGLYGRFTHGTGAPPPARGALRLRLVTATGWADLRGAISCELLDDDARLALIGRLGPDPLRADADPDLAWARVSRSRVGIGALLMQQEVLAGVGNVYRAEVLFRQRIDPFLPGRQLRPEQWAALWADLAVLMRAGVRSGRIITTRPEDRPAGRHTGRVRAEDAHYVYRRAGRPCRVCGSPVLTRVVAGRNLFWCPQDQAPGA